MKETVQSFLQVLPLGIVLIPDPRPTPTSTAKHTTKLYSMLDHSFSFKQIPHNTPKTFYFGLEEPTALPLESKTGPDFELVEPTALPHEQVFATTVN